jgi:hypothetical protein
MNQELQKTTKKGRNGLTTKQKQIIAAAIAVVALVGGGAGIYFATRPSSEESVENITSEAGVGTPNFNEYAEYSLALKDGENAITEAGVYNITGTASGYIHVNVEDKNVKLILDGVSLTSNGTPAIFVENAKNVVIELVGDNQVTATVANQEHPGAIYSKDDLLIQGEGNLTINSDEDALVSKDDLEIANGNITISCSDDAIRGNDSVKISGGNVVVERSKEGIESEVVAIVGGNISVTATDDGINVADKNGEGNPLSLTISGGTTYVNAGGDGLDSNGSIYISGGTTYVDGPLNDGNGPLDYEEKMEVTGGTLIAVGSSGMAMNASSSTQASVLVGLNGSASGELSIGSLSYSPKKAYSSVYITSPELKIGETYDLKAGSSTTSVTISDNITNVNISGMGMMGGGHGGPSGRGGQGGQAPSGQTPSGRF